MHPRLALLFLSGICFSAVYVFTSRALYSPTRPIDVRHASEPQVLSTQCSQLLNHKDERIATLERQLAVLRAKSEERSDVLDYFKKNIDGSNENSGGSSSSSSIPFEPFCSQGVRDGKFRHDMREKFNWEFRGRAQLHSQLAGPQEHALVRDPRWWCDKLGPIDESSPGRLPADSASLKCDSTGVVVGLLTGDNVAYSRASAMRDTWLQRCNTTYMFTVNTNPSLPSVGLRDEYPDDFKGDSLFIIGQARRRRMKLRDPVGEISLYGMKYMYDRHPNAKWYWMSACDIWVDVPELMRTVEPYDPDTQGWLMPYIFTHDCSKPNDRINHICRAGYKLFKDTWKHKDLFHWTSGGYGILLSRKMLGVVLDNFEPFRALMPREQLGRANDVQTGALLSFLGYQPTQLKHNKFMYAMAADTYPGQKIIKTNGLLSSHYISPMRALSLDQWNTHRKIEQLAEFGEAERLVKYFKEFADHSYDALRRRNYDMRFVMEVCENLSEEERETYWTNRWEDIPSLNATLGEKSDPDLEQVWRNRIKQLKENK